ncbi:MAG: Co2+/Mg2+ efflux protein ApaG [Rubrivivax sp.]|nr:Co2+/Mg2+ efflux protein ApaG [Rubrivivax sp.]MCL4699238.1 Co2+/Mg2+ efflux protein ApaG [Burkholderiaceae bacterium]
MPASSKASSKPAASTLAQFNCEVRVQFLPEQSQLPEGPFAFSYTVTIRNTGGVTAQLVARHWVITNAEGRAEEVRGLAVVGHQPVLKPGEHFEYTSWTRLDTPHGQMRGTFLCVTEDARPFEAEVPEFQLVYPGLLQ